MEGLLGGGCCNEVNYVLRKYEERNERFEKEWMKRNEMKE